ncbi:MerR family transcriptional regulator [Brachybacterium saurashtrense]|uniref:MerR family transcriptional regulator n=1 Tax=Brachybacterium saurashtrense TaxID=556288 RepID=A0A345YMC9_9MICO|nr:MerR family transcriptional regulator [Brachybacterium saurashtrense]RRR21765.1 MerR family transcriptional regulator [Brachybacterium saurashtrense]
MPASASRRPSPSAAARLSIGQVLEILRDEFPELAHSKLHYLESEGLIAPERTPAGYRKYSREDVDRLRFVLRAQRDRFWPLKVIKEHLLEHGIDSEVTSIASRPGPTSALQAVRLDRRGLLREAAVEEDFLAELEQFGMLAEGVLFYGAAELEIVTAARDLAEEGLHPRHLVMLRTAAERQAHMIRSVARPRSRTGDAAARGEAENFARDLGESMITLHSAMLRTNLRDG